MSEPVAQMAEALRSEARRSEGVASLPSGAERDESPSLAALAAALAKAQGEIGNASKDNMAKVATKTGRDYTYKYATLADVRDACRMPLAANGLAVLQLPSTVSGGVLMTTMLVHSSGEWIRSRLFMPVANPDAQGIGSAITYARKYSLAAMIGVAADDDEGAAASGNKLEKISGNPAADIAAAKVAALKPATASAPHPVDAIEVLVPFGKSKGKRLSEITDADLSWLSNYAEKAITDPEKAQYRAENQRLYDACGAQMAARMPK